MSGTAARHDDPACMRSAVVAAVRVRVGLGDDLREPRPFVAAPANHGRDCLLVTTALPQRRHSVRSRLRLHCATQARARRHDVAGVLIRRRMKVTDVTGLQHGWQQHSRRRTPMRLHRDDGPRHRTRQYTCIAYAAPNVDANSSLLAPLHARMYAPAQAQAHTQAHAPHQRMRARTRATLPRAATPSTTGIALPCHPGGVVESGSCDDSATRSAPHGGCRQSP